MICFRARSALWLLVVTTIAAALGGCGSATVSAERQVGAAPTAPPSVVYVTDFELDAGNVHAQRGVLPPPPPPPPVLGNLLPALPGAPVEPAVRARQVVDLMSQSLVKDLAAKGATVHRLGRGEPPPANGWLIRGVFTNVDEGNRFRRAVIGFGAGQTDLQVLVAVDDLTQGAPKPIYEVDTAADSGKLPGAAITLNPYVAAARFVLSGSDLDRNVKQTATQIAEQVARRLKESAAPR
jgi:uncharacterized protein DUF4410